MSGGACPVPQAVYRWIRQGTLDATTVTVGKRKWRLIYGGDVEHGDAYAAPDPRRLPGGWVSLSAAARRSQMSRSGITYRAERGLVRATRVTRGTRTYWLIAEDALEELGKRPQAEHVEGEAERQSGMTEGAITYRARRGLYERFGSAAGPQASGSLRRMRSKRWQAAAQTGREPLAMSVVIDGQRVWLGENITDEVGQCTSSGQAREPAINPADGALAAFVQLARSRSDQDRIDLPWSLVVITDGVAEPVLDNLRDAVCLAWTNDGDLLFSADMGPRSVTPDGVYRVHRDGTGLSQIGTRALEYCSLSPDDSTIIGTDGGSWPPPDDSNAPNAILSYPIAP